MESINIGFKDSVVHKDDILTFNWSALQRHHRNLPAVIYCWLKVISSLRVLLSFSLVKGGAKVGKLWLISRSDLRGSELATIFCEAWTPRSATKLALLSSMHITPLKSQTLSWSNSTLVDCKNFLNSANCFDNSGFLFFNVCSHVNTSRTYQSTHLKQKSWYIFVSS